MSYKTDCLINLVVIVVPYRIKIFLKRFEDFKNDMN